MMHTCYRCYRRSRYWPERMCSDCAEIERRTGMLATNLRVAALEEMRVRAAFDYVVRRWGYLCTLRRP